MKPITVLFACVQNAGRSQMAAAWFNRLANPRRARAISAGTQPAERVHPEVARAMAEIGIDLSASRPQVLSEEVASRARYLVTMGCGDACPHVPGLRRADWSLPDPEGRPLDEVRAIRDQIRDQVSAFVRSNGWDEPARSAD